MAAGESAGVAANGKVAFDAPANGRGPASGSPVDLGTVLAGVSAGITVQDSSGRLLYANQVAARMSGFETPEELLTASRDDLVSRYVLLDEAGGPFDVNALPGRRVLHGETPEPTLVGFRLADGVERWTILHATPAVLSDGQTVAINTFHDVTPRIETERRTRERERRFREMTDQRRRAEDRLDSVLREMPVGVILVDASNGMLLFANEAARRLPHIQFRIGETLHYLENEGYRVDGSRLGADDWPLRRAMRGESTRNEVLTIVDASGERRAYNISAGPMRDRSGGVDLLLETVTDITERMAAEDRERFLSRASEVLGSSLDYEQTVQAVADLAVPQFADWCVVQLADEEGGQPKRIAVAHRDREKLAAALEASREYPEDPESPNSAAAILRDGHAVYVPDITAEQLEAAARDDRHRELLHSIAPRSVISVPLVASGRIIGVLSMVSGESGRRFEATDVAFAEDLARRAAAAIEAARLFREGVRFKRLLDATSDAVLMLDLDGTVVYANQSAGQQLGRDSTDLLGGSIRDHVHPDDAETMADAIGRLDRGEADARTLTVRLDRADGAEMPVEIRLQVVSLVAEPRRVLAVARDRREQIAAESALRTLAVAEHARAAELNAVIRAMGEGVVVCDREGRIILANPAAEDTFPEIEETSYADILGELEDADRAPRLGTTGGPVELRARRGDERWIEISTWPVGPDQGEDLRDETIVVLRDVTEARQRQAVRDTFIGVLSHELRTPVTTIYAGAKVLARTDSDLSPGTRREIFTDMVIESERLHRLVEDVVAMQRFGEESGDVGAEPVLLQRLLPTVVTSETSRWPGVNFETSIPSGLPTVVADPTYVEQVVRNLLSNAAKYGGAGATVGVEVEAVGNEVRVRILDDGPGFPPDETDRLFELFFRSAGTSRTASGAGIGLFVCARLIRAMGGRIWATNRDGGGAEFGFALRVMSEE